MNKIILLNFLLAIIMCLIGIVSVLFKKIELENSKPKWLRQEEKRKRYVIPVDEYIANQEKYRKGGWRY